MRPSIVRNLLFSFPGTGVLMAAIFPFHAHFFVTWQPDMPLWFVVGCLVAGLIMGFVNYSVMNLVLISRLRPLPGRSRQILLPELTSIMAPSAGVYIVRP